MDIGKLAIPGFLAVIIGVPVVMLNHVDAAYTKVSATVQSMEKDCFVKIARTSLIDKETGEMAFLDCDEAEIIAPLKGLSKSAVRPRYRVTVSYVSPADSTSREAKFAFTSGREKKYAVGKTLTIRAHNKDPLKALAL